MKATRLITAAAVVAAGAVSLASCSSDDNTTAGSGASASPASIACATGTLHGAGSTFQANIVQQWIKDIGNACSGATIDYQGVGSGAGIQQFGSGTIDFGGSDAVMKDDEQAAADKRCGAPAIHLPITAGGIALIYKLDGVDNLQLSPDTVAGIFQGTITKWNDKAIADDNAGVTLPSTSIQAVHRSDSSGTTNIFSSWLTAASPSAWKLGKGKDLDWAASIQGFKGSDGIAQAVSTTDGAIGYDELSFATANNLPTAKVKNGAGEYTGPTTDAVSAALGSATLPSSGNDLKASFDYTTTASGVYPITGLSYEIVCSTGTKADVLPLLKAYLTYAAGAGQSAAASLGYAPLPSAVASRVVTAINSLA